ncbi:MAG: hypothetical protein Q9217_001691 [Psora testacea]
MSINKFLVRLVSQCHSKEYHSAERSKHSLGDCKARGLSESEYGLIKRLTTRLSTVSERSFIGGRYLMPLTLRYDNQDISKYTIDKTCIFFSFPYLCLDTIELRKYYDKGHLEHPPRTLLQSHYRLNKTKDRDKLQCVRWLKAHKLASYIIASDSDKAKLPREKVQELFYVPQFWGLIGLLNKKQQILEYLQDDIPANGKTEPGDETTMKCKTKASQYHFWRDDDGIQITFDNWLSILQDSRDRELLSIRMQVDTPTMILDAPGIINPGTGDASKYSPPAKSKDSRHELKTPAFLAWPMQDEFGEKETLPIEKRVSRFLRAVYLKLPVPNDMTVKERVRRPQAVSEKRAQARQTLSIHQTTYAELEKHIQASSLGPFAQELLDKSKSILQLFLPSSLGIDFDSDAIRIFWGAVSEILQEAKRESEFEPHLRIFIATLDRIITNAACLHQGVHCSRSRQVPGKSEWRDEDGMADGAVLLSAVVDALGSIFHMFVEATRYVKSSADDKKSGLMGPSFKVTEHAKEALAFFEVARDQLIREADGRDNNDTVGPVLTPEAISIAVMERLVSGVYRSGTVDVIGVYEECLEHLDKYQTLQVKYEASRRLLQKINEFSEEIAIVKDVLKQQNNVLLRLRSALDPTSFRAPSLARKLRFGYECKGIDRILMIIKEQLRAYAELGERARQLSIENIELVETLQDDNSKAIFIFTMVTILFLPLSFVAAFFGMNLHGVSDNAKDVGHFWKIALPLTAGIITVCGVVAIKGEDTYFTFARMWRYTRGFFPHRL